MQQVIPDSLNIVLGQQRIADCLKSVNHIGSTTYMDVCNGASYSVPWGGGDWIGNIAFGALLGGLGVLMLFLVALLVAMGIDIVREGL